MGYPLQSNLLKGTFLTAFFLLVFIFNSFAQSVIKGKVIDETTNEALPGVTISVKGSNKGTSTNIDGSFTLKLGAGEHSIIINYVSYTTQETKVSVADGETKDLGVIKLATNAISMKEVVVSTNVAIDRKTPVAVSTIKASEIQNKIGNNEFPEVLRSTPSTYVTKSSGGFGDSRINVRGFSQENIAVMINGVPVNGMEDSRVYWSNWAGLSDIASTIQVQRGLGASKLSVSSVGGTINIVTKPTEMEKGGSVGSSFGNDGYMKYNLALSSGKMKNGLAFSVLGSYTQGDGYIDGTSFKGWNYFASLAWEINKKHTLTLSATGAPQRHNQRAGASSYDFYMKNVAGVKYNNAWGYLNGEQFNMAQNFYHKPVLNLNHYWNINEKTNVSTVAYASVGIGGADGAYGKINNQQYFQLPRVANTVQYDEIVKFNEGLASNFGTTGLAAWNKPDGGIYNGKQVATSATGIVQRSSMNEHNWFGIISNISHQLTTNLNINGGVDYRYYKGLHYQRIVDLLGADYYNDGNLDANNPNKFVVADKTTPVGYNNNGYVQQIGGFASAEYSITSLDVFFAGSVSNTSYKREDLFLLSSDPNQMTPVKNYLGYTAKGGANYRLNDMHNVFANVGYFSRAPFFNTVYAGNSNDPKKIFDLKNENVFGVELGYGFRSKYFSANINAYNTKWDNKTLTKSVTDNTLGVLKQVTTGLSALHQGIEVDMLTKPVQNLEVNGMLSLGNWRWKGNGTLNTYDENSELVAAQSNKTVYLNNIKVGDAAQTTLGLGTSYQIVKGLKVRADYYYATNLYASYTLADRNVEATATRQAWELPSYSLFNAGASYNVKVKGYDLTFRAQVDNIANVQYMSESTTDKAYLATTAGDYQIGNGGSALNNNVYFGFGRTFSAGFSVRF